MQNDTPLTILVIDDDPDHNSFIATLLTRAGYSVTAFRDGDSAMRYAAQSRPALVITDIFMPRMDGFEVLRHIKGNFPLLPVIAMSGNMSGHGPLYLESIRMLGAERTFVKPIIGTELLDAVSKLVGQPHLKRVSRQ